MSTDEKKWYDKTWAVVLWLFVFPPLGLFGLWKNAQIGKGWKYSVSGLFGLALLFQVSATEQEEAISSEEIEGQGESVEETSDDAFVQIGAPLLTEYFEITAKSMEISDRVSTGNEYSDLPPEAGVRYLIIEAIYKNIDTESRMLSEGSVWINYNGSDYEFDKTETIMEEGWGIFLDQINPLMSKSTKIVYKVPEEVKGEVYWQPGRAEEEQFIYLGELK